MVEAFFEEDRGQHLVDERTSYGGSVPERLGGDVVDDRKGRIANGQPLDPSRELGEHRGEEP